ncbi:hypothetical protein [Weissella confusa]|uniref:hypothetical protein n=1 Tax=Weissella confusa TaxID=1583 RepID=UPI00107EEF8A|nr:hypothetical protein [Weissella confusa]MBJ7656478.1 hypothetical protein [Weissella confusa]TGE44924.1 hypothetical protein C6P25_01305 [Weissella confusa]
MFTPTLVFYQMPWSLFDLNQASRRAWRIGQTRETRTYYLAYSNTFQATLANLVAKKNKATEAIKGTPTSGGFSALLGDDDEDLQPMMMKAAFENVYVPTNEGTPRAKELLAHIGEELAVEDNGRMTRSSDSINAFKKPEPYTITMLINELQPTHVQRAEQSISVLDTRPQVKSITSVETFDLLDAPVVSESNKIVSKPSVKVTGENVSQDVISALTNHSDAVIETLLDKFDVPEHLLGQGKSLISDDLTSMVQDVDTFIKQNNIQPLVFERATQKVHGKVVELDFEEAFLF